MTTVAICYCEPERTNDEQHTNRCATADRRYRQENALREAADNAKRNRLTILHGDGPCYCAHDDYEDHEGACLGPYCYCH
jgi:hypothetical protein